VDEWGCTLLLLMFLMIVLLLYPYMLWLPFGTTGKGWGCTRIIIIVIIIITIMNPYVPCLPCGKMGKGRKEQWGVLDLRSKPWLTTLGCWI
jgi:hypothetical protein